MRIVLFLMIVVAGFARAETLQHHQNAILKFGFSFGTATEPQPALIITSHEQYDNCFAVGFGTLIGDRVKIKLSKMTCGDDKFFYEYELTDSFVRDENGTLGLQANNVLPSKELSKSLEGLEKVYKYLGDVETAKDIENARKGHWDIEANTKVIVVLSSPPVLKSKIAVNTLESHN
jgi:hypothetical protein